MELQSQGVSKWEFGELGFLFLFLIFFLGIPEGFQSDFSRGGKWDFNGGKSGAEGFLGFNFLFISAFISVFIPALGALLAPGIPGHAPNIRGLFPPWKSRKKR